MIWDLNKYSDNIFAINENGQKYFYNDLFENGQKLKEQICETKPLCFILSSNSAGSILGYTCFLNNNIVPVLIDKNLNKDLLNILITTYKPNYIWCPFYFKFKEYSEKYNKWEYSLLESNNKFNFKLYKDLALLQTTSGSTGSPKLVRLSYKNIISNTESIIEYLNINKNERPITSLPMNYSYGLSVLNTHLYVGATVILTDYSIMQKEFWKLVQDYKVTSLAGVPYIYEMLTRLRFTNMDLPYLKTLTQAGGKLSDKLQEKFAIYAKENNKKFYVMYGQTEATARISYLPNEKVSEKIGSVGVAVPNGKFSILDINNNEINEPGIEGELIYKGENVSLGYAETIEDLSKGDERCGVLKTGDIAKLDQDGYCYIVGRIKRFLKIFGSRVNLDEVQKLVEDTFDTECVCTGIDNNMSVYITDETKKDIIKKFLAEKLSFHPSVFNMKIIDKIPRNSSGKVLYSKLV